MTPAAAFPCWLTPVYCSNVSFSLTRRMRGISRYRIGRSDLDAAAIIAKPNTTKVYERDITVNGLPAKEIKFVAKGVDYIARGLFVANRLFMFVAALDSKADNAETIVRQAFDSFEPIKK